MKVACYGASTLESKLLKELNIYNYDLKLIEKNLEKNNVCDANNADAVLVRGNCNVDATNIKALKACGVKYILTRSAGYNHINLQEAKKANILVARVPIYSPNAIAELAVTLSLMLLRHTAYTTYKTSKKDFTIDEFMYSKELRNCTVGIIGVGNIGQVSAKLFKGFGAKVVGYDIAPSASTKEYLEFLELEELLNISDIVSVHVPYVRGVNDKFINKNFLAQMKKSAILINTSRGAIQDEKAILEAIEQNNIEAYGSDVLNNEVDFFRKDMQGKKLDDTLEKLISYYPRVLITPHIGAYTDTATTNLISISFDNLNEFLTMGFCQNQMF